MTIYEKFIYSSLDLSALGLHCGELFSKSSLTPPNARILAWLIDSPIHFCQIPELGSTVIAVIPSGLPDEQLLPVAKDIPDFIGLLIRCKDASLIAGAHQWSSYLFNEKIAAVNPGMKARSVIRALENTYHPPIIDDPGALMSQLRKELAHIPPKVSAPVWKVGFEIDFSQDCPKGAAGKELVLKHSITHTEGTWHVPAAYLCEDGIVVDTLLEVSQERLLDYRDRWSSRSEETLSLSDKLQRQLDDPLAAAVTGVLTVNDKTFRCKKGFTALWNPLVDNDATVRRILKHYSLDPDRGYLFKRYSFLRKGKYPQIRTMQLTLEAIPVPIPDKTFTLRNAGERFRFTHPVTGLEHTFTALSITNEALNPNFLTNHPCCYTRLNYTLEPAISAENFRVVDQNPGDYWEGYQDDPATIIYADKKPAPGRYALSSLHYEPQKEIHWQMIFRRKLHKDMQLKLLP